MADSAAQLSSLFSCIIKEQSFTLAGIRVFLYHHVHRMECVEHLICRVHDAFILFRREWAPQLELTRSCAAKLFEAEDYA